MQRGFLPRWLATFLGVFMALAITFVMLWIAYKPQVRSERHGEARRGRCQHAGAQPLGDAASAAHAPPRPPRRPRPRHSRRTPVAAVAVAAGAEAVPRRRAGPGEDRGHRGPGAGRGRPGRAAHLLPGLRDGRGLDGRGVRRPDGRHGRRRTTRSRPSTSPCPAPGGTGSAAFVQSATSGPSRART